MTEYAYRVSDEWAHSRAGGLLIDLRCAHCGHPLDEPEPYMCLRVDHPTGLMHQDCHLTSGCPCAGDDDG